MSAAPYMKLYVADYLGDTQHLTTEQHGAYLLLLMSMWLRGAKLPNDPVVLARIAGLSPRRWGQIGRPVIELFEEDDAFLTHKRLRLEYEKATAKSHVRSVAGRAGGLSKALNNKESGLAFASDLPEPEGAEASSDCGDAADDQREPDKSLNLHDDGMANANPGGDAVPMTSGANYGNGQPEFSGKSSKILSWEDGENSCKPLNSNGTGLANATILPRHILESRVHIEEPDPNGSGVPTHPPDLMAGLIDDRPRSPPPAAAMLAIWRDVLPMLPAPVKLTQKRMAALGARYRDEFGGDLERWRKYCERIRGSPFLCGDNDRAWKADIDWSINPSNAAKVLEGNYDKRKPNNPAKAAGHSGISADSPELTANRRSGIAKTIERLRGSDRI